MSQFHDKINLTLMFNFLSSIFNHAVTNYAVFIFFNLIYRLCVMFLVPSTAFVAALLFAVHPIHTEAVSLISVCNQKVLTPAFYQHCALKSLVQCIIWMNRFSCIVIGATLTLAQEKFRNILSSTVATRAVHTYSVPEELEMAGHQHKWIKEEEMHWEGGGCALLGPLSLDQPTIYLGL